MTKENTSINSIELSKIPSLVEFLVLKPDEQLRITKLKTNDDKDMLELIKLETPVGTDDIAMSGYKKVTLDEINSAANFLRNSKDKHMNIGSEILFDVYGHLFKLQEKLK